MRILVLAALAAALFPALFAGATAAGAASARDRAAPRPNIVLVVADDQRWDSLGGMPTVTSELGRQGVTFTNAFTVNPQCCPSRASLLTGRYSHATGVYANSGPHGGFRAFDDSTTLATALDEAGYTTGLFGKYLNGYGGRRGAGYVPPGWDVWSVFYGGSDGYYDYRLAQQRRVTRYGRSPDHYSTTVLARQAASFVRNTREPFFLELAPYAPHAPALTPPGRAQAFEESPWSTPVSFDERDVSDKPAHIRRLRALTARDIRDAERFRRRQLLASLGVDDAVRRVLDELDARGALERTVVVYTSDNGVAWGEHLLAPGRKAVPYEEQIRIPLVVRYDPITGKAPRTDRHLVLNVDIAPTLARLAGAMLPGTQGRSLLRLLRGREPVDWRGDFLVEHLARGAAWDVPTYCAVRNGRYKYVLYGTREEELYDLARDPHELQNLAGAANVRALQRRLLARLETLCRPAPPGFHALAAAAGRR
jgi:N-acetylglucosamine-6-sulfatase